MLKRLLCLLLALLLLPLSAALGEDDGLSALTLEELTGWAQGYKTRAMAAQPLNDPTEPGALSEDGYAFVYDFATLYMDRPEMTEDSVLKNLVVTDAMEEGPRGTRVDMLSGEILASFYNENNLLEGNRGFAALYLGDSMPSSASWAWLQRDGQRVMAIQYAVHEQLAAGGDGYTDAGLVYTIQDNLVAAIRAYGLDSVIDEADVQDNLAAVRDVFEDTSYAQVPVSYVGTDLEPFGESDLTFSGIDFLTLTPEAAQAALGDCLEDMWMEDDTGEFIRTMEFAGCEMTFIYDSKKENPRAEMLSMVSDGMEGPRCVRVGDTFSSVLIRFRYNEGEYENNSEVLYGDPTGDMYGMAEYGDDASATLRYAFRTQEGRQAVLYMTFEAMSLREALLYFNE